MDFKNKNMNATITFQDLKSRKVTTIWGDSVINVKSVTISLNKHKYTLKHYSLEEPENQLLTIIKYFDKVFNDLRDQQKDFDYQENPEESFIDINNIRALDEDAVSVKSYINSKRYMLKLYNYLNMNIDRVTRREFKLDYLDSQYYPSMQELFKAHPIKNINPIDKLDELVPEVADELSELLMGVVYEEDILELTKNLPEAFDPMLLNYVFAEFTNIIQKGEIKEHFSFKEFKEKYLDSTENASKSFEDLQKLIIKHIDGKRNTVIPEDQIKKSMEQIYSKIQKMEEEIHEQDKIVKSCNIKERVEGLIRDYSRDRYEDLLNDLVECKLIKKELKELKVKQLGEIESGEGLLDFELNYMRTTFTQRSVYYELLRSIVDINYFETMHFVNTSIYREFSKDMNKYEKRLFQLIYFRQKIFLNRIFGLDESRGITSFYSGMPDYIKVYIILVTVFKLKKIDDSPIQEYFNLPPIEQLYKKYLKIYPLWTYFAREDQHDRYYKESFTSGTPCAENGKLVEKLPEKGIHVPLDKRELNRDGNLERPFHETVAKKEKNILEYMILGDIWKIVDKYCTKPQADCLKLKYNPDIGKKLTDKEIAEKIGLTQQNVQKHINKAYERLREEIDKIDNI